MSSGRGTSKAVWRTLGEVCIVVAGGTPSKKDASYWEHGTIKWLGSTVCQNQKNIENQPAHSRDFSRELDGFSFKYIKISHCDILNSR